MQSFFIYILKLPIDCCFTLCLKCCYYTNKDFHGKQLKSNTTLYPAQILMLLYIMVTFIYLCTIISRANSYLFLLCTIYVFSQVHVFFFFYLFVYLIFSMINLIPFCYVFGSYALSHTGPVLCLLKPASCLQMQKFFPWVLKYSHSQFEN